MLEYLLDLQVKVKVTNNLISKVIKSMNKILIQVILNNRFYFYR